MKPVDAVLMDSWYAAKEAMLFIEELKTVYSCPIKHNRQVDELGGGQPYGRVDALKWSDEEKQYGKVVKL